jgi:hypothetical protein
MEPKRTGVWWLYIHLAAQNCPRVRVAHLCFYFFIQHGAQALALKATSDCDAVEIYEMAVPTRKPQVVRALVRRAMPKRDAKRLYCVVGNYQGML